MPGKLMHKERDPNFHGGPERHKVKVDRGSGWYYHRGRGQWSKYDEHLDAMKKRPRTKVSDIDTAEKLQPHKADYKTLGDRKTPRMKGHHMKGYF